MDYVEALGNAETALRSAQARGCIVYTSNDQFNDWLSRSGADLAMLTTDNPEGPYPYAGVPWFSTPFGRDGILTALQYLWVDPAMARAVLALLARTQASKESPEQDAEPGKILHEMPRRRACRSGRDSIRPLLRQRRFDAAVHRAGRCLLPPHVRSRVPAQHLARTSSVRSHGSSGTAMSTATASSNTTSRVPRA